MRLGVGSMLRVVISAGLVAAQMGLALGQDAPAAKSDPAQDLRPPSVLFDPFTGDVLSQNRAGEPWYPASLTKMMTAYVVFRKIREGKLSLTQQLPISALANSQPASRIGIPAGKTVTVDFALQALLVHSANDMAYVLAEGASGSVDGFAGDMNDIAKSVGLQSTHFVNPNGLYDPRHISSARDMGVIAALIINQFPEHLHYFKQEYVRAGGRRLPNHNGLVRTMPEMVGMKTGFVCNSGYNLVGSAIRDGKQLVSVVLGAKSGWARSEMTKDMLDQGFGQLGKVRNGKLSEISDQAFGAIVPVDMTPTVCKRKPAVVPVNGHRLSRWGISFGNFDTAKKADMALRGRLISPVGIDAGGIPGIIALPNKGGFNAMLWNFDEQKSADLCAKYRGEGAACDVMPDTLLAQIAAAAPPDPDADQADAEGDGTDVLDPQVKEALAKSKAKKK